MSWSDAGAIGLAILAFALGILGARAVGRMLFHERGRREDAWQPYGVVYGSDMVLRVALIVVWGGFVIGSLALLPGLAWAVDGDGEALEISTRMLLVGGSIVAVGVLASLPGLRLVVLQPQHLTKAGVLRNTSIALAAVDSIDESKTLPGILVRGSDDTIRLSRTMANFDDLFNRLSQELPASATSRMRDAGGPAPTGGTPNAPEDGRYAVGRLRIRLNLGFLAVMLLFFIAWPWFLVEGEHPIRDSFAFVGIGLSLWLALAFLVANETLQRGQPVELELRSGSIAWRTLRGAWRERAAAELVSASVEPEIIYIKGQPGRRYPLRLRFVDDEILEIDDFRGRHLGSSTHNIGIDVRGRYLDTAARTPAHQAESTAQLESALAAEARGEPLEAVGHFRHAIAAWPSKTNLALYARVADLLREHGTEPEHRKLAIAHYRAHVDLFPSDASAWQALGASLSGGLRSDAADEAIATAEQILFAGRDQTNEIRAGEPEAERNAVDN